MRVERDVYAAGILVLVQDSLPSLTAIGRAEDAPFGIRTVGMTKCSHQNNVCILGIDNDSADSAAVVKPDVLPGLAAIDGLVNSIAMRNIAADASLSCAYVNNVWVRWRDGDAADGGGSLLVKHRSPGDRAIGGLPDAAARRAEVIGCRIAGDA